MNTNQSWFPYLKYSSKKLFILPSNLHQAYQSRLFQPGLFQHILLSASRLHVTTNSYLLSKYTEITTYKIIIFIFFFYGYETWSLILPEEYRLRMSGNTEPRNIFTPRREGVRRDCKTLQNTAQWGAPRFRFSPKTIQTIKSKRLGRRRRVVLRGKTEMNTGIWRG